MIREKAADFIIEVSGWKPPAEAEGFGPAGAALSIEEMKHASVCKECIAGK